MSQEHTITHVVPAALVQRAVGAGIDLVKLLELVQKYGPLAVQILDEILSHLASK